MSKHSAEGEQAEVSLVPEFVVVSEKLEQRPVLNTLQEAQQAEKSLKDGGISDAIVYVRYCTDWYRVVDEA